MDLWLIAVRFTEGIAAGAVWILVAVKFRGAASPERNRFFGGLAGFLCALLLTLAIVGLTDLHRYAGNWPWLLGLTNVLSYREGFLRGRGEG